jgi:hypothetical protein
MDTIWFHEPTGDCFPNPTAEQMREVLRRGEDYWGGYSCLGWLQWHRHAHQEVPSQVGLGSATRKAQLLFVASPEHGWYFEYDDYREEDDEAEQERHLVPHDASMTKEKWVRQYAHGEPMYFRSACFVPQGVAEQIVTDFLETLRPSAAVRWGDGDSIGARLSVAEYRSRRRSRQRRT